MPYTIEYDRELDYIIVVVDGLLDLSLLENLASDVAKAIVGYGCVRILNDMRGASLRGITDTFQMPQAASKSGIEFGAKRALVFLEDSPGSDFLETVFVNRGHWVKTFTSIDEARRWLLKD